MKIVLTQPLKDGDTQYAAEEIVDLPEDTARFVLSVRGGDLVTPEANTSAAPVSAGRRSRDS